MENQEVWKHYLKPLNHLDLNTILILAAGYQFQHVEIERIVKALNPGQKFKELLKAKGFICDNTKKMANPAEWKKFEESLNHLDKTTLLSLAAGIQFEPEDVFQIWSARNPGRSFTELYKFKGDYKMRMANYTYQRPSHPVREYGLVLAGKVGCGKSSTGNTILERTAFTSNPSAQSVTNESSYATSVNGDCKITVVDTPGVNDYVRSDSIIKQEIARMAFLLREGVHCFVICLSASEVRFTGETKQFLDQVKVSGNADFFDYCMLVYTKPETELCDISLNEFLERQKENADMKSFLGKIGNRVLAVNNKPRDLRERKRNKEAIIATVDKVIEDNMIKNNPITFTNDTFKKANELRAKVVSLVETKECHPSLINAVIEAVIWFSNWGAIAENEFVNKVINILCNSAQCDKQGRNLVFRNDDEVTTISVADCEKHIKMIYKEIRSNIGLFYKMLGKILNYKKTYLLTTGALTAGAGALAGMTGIGAVGAILGVPAIIAYGIGSRMS